MKNKNKFGTLLMLGAMLFGASSCNFVKASQKGKNQKPKAVVGLSAWQIAASRAPFGTIVGTIGGVGTGLLACYVGSKASSEVKLASILASAGVGMILGLTYDGVELIGSYVTKATNGIGGCCGDGMNIVVENTEDNSCPFVSCHRNKRSLFSGPVPLNSFGDGLLNIEGCCTVQLKNFKNSANCGVQTDSEEKKEENVLRLKKKD